MALCILVTIILYVAPRAIHGEAVGVTVWADNRASGTGPECGTTNQDACHTIQQAVYNCADGGVVNVVYSQQHKPYCCDTDQNNGAYPELLEYSGIRVRNKSLTITDHNYDAGGQFVMDCSVDRYEHGECSGTKATIDNTAYRPGRAFIFEGFSSHYHETGWRLNLSATMIPPMD